MRFAIFLFAVGAWACSQQAALPHTPVIFTLLAGALGLVLLGALVWRRLPRGVALALVAMGFGVGGFAWAALCGAERLSQTLPHALEGRNLEVVGVVASLPQRYGSGVRFEFELEHAPPGVPERVWLSWYAGLGEEEEQALSRVHAGERWRLVVRLRRPRSNLNFHGFDFEAYLFERGLRATGYVRASPNNARLAEFVPGFQNQIERTRERVRDSIERVLEGRDYAGVITALVVGDQRAVDQELWQVFNRTGITHLMAISGFHITMIAALVGFFVASIWRRVPQLALRLPVQKVALVAGLAAATAYCFLAGMGVPSQRTLCMLAIGVAALWSNRFISPGRVLMFALLVVLLIDPMAVNAAGFWLSFGAVAMLMFACSGQLRPGHWLAQAWRSQWAVTLGLIPVLLALFGQFSLVSPIANALAIPLVSFVVTPLALLGAFVGFDGSLVLSERILAAMMVPIEWLAELPWAIWSSHTSAPWVVALATVGCAVMLLPRGLPLRALGAVMLLPLFFVLPERAAHGQAKVTVLDVGQGLAVHVQTAQHDLMFDAGPQFSADANSGNRIIAPYLRASGVDAISMLVISHEDRDHSGGVHGLAEGVKVARVLDSLPAESSWRPEDVPSEPCYAGQSWEWDGVRFDMLNPAGPEGGRNDRSCVLRVSAGNRRVLIASDIEAAAETQMLARLGAGLRADILIAPHHGSKTSSTPAFLAAVAAREVVFAVGYRNRYRHPNKDVWQRHADTGARLTRTDRDGAVRFVLGGDEVPALARQTRRRFWHDPWDGP